MAPVFTYLLIDLDDTLAPEWDFVAGGYRAAAQILARAVGRDADTVFNLFVYEHMKYGRYRIMDRMVAALKAEPALVPGLVRAYRDHPPDMHFYSGVREALLRLSEAGCKLAVVTDGAIEIQRRKVESLGLRSAVDAIVLCLECKAPKPEVGAFQRAMELLRADPAKTIVVGDDPFHDLGAAAALGVPACRVRTGRYGQVQSIGTSALCDFPAFVGVASWLLGEEC